METLAVGKAYKLQTYLEDFCQNAKSTILRHAPSKHLASAYPKLVSAYPTLASAYPVTASFIRRADFEMSRDTRCIRAFNTATPVAIGSPGHAKLELKIS